MVAPNGMASLICPHNAQATVDANSNADTPPAEVGELCGLDGQFDTSAIKMVCNCIIGADGSCHFVQTDNHNVALNLFASALTIRCHHPMDPTQNIDEFVAMK